VRTRDEQATETKMQLDIFEHSREVMLRNDVIAALERRDGASARVALGRLEQECPLDESLPALRNLAEAIDGRTGEQFEEHLALTRARQVVEGALLPAAQRVFGSEGGTTWVRPLWEDLALRAEALPFRAEHAQDHAAPLWLRAGNWKAAAQAIAAEHAIMGMHEVLSARTKGVS
jgi:hypothetical protein